ncbi:hypothetical protein SDC9_167267 [bioreactor metagenome]|uniref:Uncharacterized protein n=1 Tax=bioreactor metagenome TaxID=1076179 RepID=A0A645G1T0_9ZZZZ
MIRYINIIITRNVFKKVSKCRVVVGVCHPAPAENKILCRHIGTVAPFGLRINVKGIGQLVLTEGITRDLSVYNIAIRINGHQSFKCVGDKGTVIIIVAKSGVQLCQICTDGNGKCFRRGNTSEQKSGGNRQHKTQRAAEDNKYFSETAVVFEERIKI